MSLDRGIGARPHRQAEVGLASADQNTTHPGIHGGIAHRDDQRHPDHIHRSHAAVFRDRFRGSLALSIPVIVFSHMFADLLGYQLPAGAGWVSPVLGTAVYAYGGQPFLAGAVAEIRSRRPGMMLLVDLDFWWELALLVDITTDSAVRIHVDAVGEQTALAGIRRLVEQAQTSRSRAQALADRAAALLFYIALLAGVATFVTWLALGRPTDAVERALTVLVIACPHALGLAIPLVIAVSTGIAARSGILVTDRLALERMRTVGAVLMSASAIVVAANAQLLRRNVRL